MPMDEIELRLIQATIECGAKHPRKKSFSVKTIAETAGLSTYPIFLHFKTSQNLINVSLRYALEEGIERFRSSSKESDSFEQKVERLVAIFCSMPTEMAFLANYGVWFERTESDPERQAIARDVGVRLGQEMLPLLGIPLGEEDETFLICSALLRQLIYTSQTIRNHTEIEEQAIRQIMTKAIVDGAKCLTEGDK